MKCYIYYIDYSSSVYLRVHVYIYRHFYNHVGVVTLHFALWPGSVSYLESVTDLEKTLIRHRTWPTQLGFNHHGSDESVTRP